MTPNTGDYDEKLFGEVLSKVLSDAKAMTGKKTIYITHSQGSRVGWQTDIENMAAIVAIEPGGDATVVDLPKAGITGNSHFMFQETNNKEIADHIEKMA